ncbi:uncharacterized protein LOC131941424 [Physella acuta]|uniref:uncharacterized protein LOC131941424 n=1 Tax=Physella acuta TaxID=109671 RepID=UPI0027DB1DD2|nr:uncharacterized protein LOC131941424 [Physella acuta]
MAGKENISQYFTGTHEVQECLETEGEANWDRYKKHCKKPHNEFIPVKQLTIQHFPPGYSEDICDFTKALADLVVRVSVTFASSKRPEFFPGGEMKYPCYSTRGQKTQFNGTGRVRFVTKYTKGKDDYMPCPCPECDYPATRRHVWWEVVVQTARHVVFDESEIENSSCRLWYDEDKTRVVKMYGFKLSGPNTEHDLCYFACATHDPMIGDKLKQMINRFDELWGQISGKYRSRRDVDKLTIIVSHPHGLSKQVSVGRWVHKQEVGAGTMYTYTTCTCPGSSGAIVYILGSRLSTAHTHSGTNEKGLNFSGVYLDF